MRLAFFILLSSIFLQASTVTLDDILEKLKYEHPMAKSIQDYDNAYSAQNRAKSSTKALQLFTQGAHAKPDLEESKYEYSIGVQQKIMNPSVKNSILKASTYKNDAEILSFKRKFLLLQNDIRLFYHLNCLDQRVIEQYKSSYIAFETLYIKKERAYKYGEISKKELLQLQIELDRLKSDFRHYENAEKTSRNNLQSKILLPFFEGKELSCKDTYEVSEKLLLSNTQDSLQEQSLNKKIKSLESSFKRYDTLFNSFTLSASYEDEIDTKRVVLGLSVPLNFTSSLNGENRAALLHKKSALEHEKEGVKLKRGSQVKLLEKRLAYTFEDIELVSSTLKRYEGELMPLVESGYRLGENSAIEYLLSKREIWMYRKDLIKHYKNYYEILFELYSVLEIKE